MSVQVHFNYRKFCDIHVDNQHLSRLSLGEVREIVCAILIFGGKQLREDMRGWLNGKEFESVANLLAPSELPAVRQVGQEE